MAGCYAEGGKVDKPSKPSKDNDDLAGDQEMQMRKDAAAKNRMRGAGRGPLSRNGMKDNPFGYAKGGAVRGGGCAVKGVGKGMMR